jgi:hypothetical protein
VFLHPSLSQRKLLVLHRRRKIHQRMIYREIASGVAAKRHFCKRQVRVLRRDSGPLVFLVWLGTGTLMSLLEFLIGELEICF